MLPQESQSPPPAHQQRALRLVRIKDLAIAQKDGEVILSVQSGKVQTNKVTPEILQVFENANAQIEQNQAQSRDKNQGWQR